MNSDTHSFYEYLFFLLPDFEVNSAIVSFKSELRAAVGDFSSQNSDPHITIGSITVSSRKEESLLKCIQYVCDQTEHFSIALDGFGSFKPHTVYVRLADSSGVRSFMQYCEDAAQGVSSKKGWQPKAKNPHMTIGRELGSKFNQAKQLFKDREYRAQFEVSKLRVMRSLVDGSYTFICDIPFKGCSSLL